MTFTDRQLSPPKYASQASLSQPTESGDWLVVIDATEASVFRSLASDAMPQQIRPHRREARTQPVTRNYLNGREHSALPEFYEPLAGILQGARRCLIFGRSPTLSDPAVPFVAWLRSYRPELARHILASVHLAPHEGSDASALAKARSIYQLIAVAATTKAAICSAAPQE
jgi:hypothetical protein